jgi:catechol 2,3-dioxygenase-like lactoylglutathione lyase family enzyme
MADLKVEGVVHWSIPVNSLEESERFYGELLGLEAKGRLGGSGMSCFKAGDHNILLCVRNETTVRTPQQDNRLHHAFMVSPEMWERGCRVFHENGVKIAEPIVYFTGREIYFLDPSGNMLEL